MDRQVVRETAGRMLRSDALTGNEREAAAEFLRGNPAIGNPHMVRCTWCAQSMMLFLDEEKGSFARAQRGWRCTACDEFAASQEVKF
jgi:hypothetical protein